MPISRRFMIGSALGLLAVGLASLIAIISATIWLNDRAQVHFRDVIDARDTRAAAVELRSVLQTAESSQRGLLVSGNEIYLAPYDRAKTITLRQLQVLERALQSYEAAKLLYPRLLQVVNDKIADMDQSIALKNQRQDDEALRLFRTNRGKALMDEANVFLSGIIRATDEKLLTSVGEQNSNARWLRSISMLGALVIALVVAGLVITFLRYTQELAGARDEVRQLNSSLEARVSRRTADLAQARDRAETLLAEVNHRVANSLALVAGLVRLQSKTVTDQAAKAALGETEARISAVASVHKRLYSSGSVQTVDLREYLSGLLDNLANALRSEGLGSRLRHDLDPLQLRTDASINLGVIVTEWVTNAFKYAYPETSGDVVVRLRRLADGRAELVVEDDGVGRAGQNAPQGTGLGTRIVRAMAESIKAEAQYGDRSPGTSARLIFPV